MASDNATTMEAPAPVTKPAPKKTPKKPDPAKGKAVLAKAKGTAKTAPKPAKKGKNAVGNNRGIAKKPDGWINPKPLMKNYLKARDEDGKKGIELAEYINPAQTRALILLADAKGPIPGSSFTTTVAKAFMQKHPEFRGKDGNPMSAIGPAYVSWWVGNTDPDARPESESRWGYVSLITMGCVRCYKSDDNDVKQWVYEITPQGRKWLERKLKAGNV
jgi:hypothetical protein